MQFPIPYDLFPFPDESDEFNLEALYIVDAMEEEEERKRRESLDNSDDDDDEQVEEY